MDRGGSEEIRFDIEAVNFRRVMPNGSLTRKKWARMPVREIRVALAVNYCPYRDDRGFCIARFPFSAENFY